MRNLSQTPLNVDKIMGERPAMEMAIIHCEGWIVAISATAVLKGDDGGRSEHGDARCAKEKFNI
jgi:hypothetical protein